MLMEVMRSLRDSGIAVEYHDMPTDAHDQVDEVLDVLADGRRARFALDRSSPQ